MALKGQSHHFSKKVKPRVGPPYQNVPILEGPELSEEEVLAILSRDHELTSEHFWKKKNGKFRRFTGEYRKVIHAR